MNKKSIILMPLLACALTASAQINGNGGDFEQKPKSQTHRTNGTDLQIKTKNYGYEFSMGVRAGAGVSMMSEGDDLKVYDGSGISYGGGVVANVRFGSKDSRGRALHGQGLFGIGLELNYKNHTVKTLGGEDLKMGYFEVPLMFQFYPMYNSKQMKNLYIEVGPTFAGTLSSSPEYLEVDNTRYKTGDLKGFDVKATVGLGYRFNTNAANEGFHVNARYYLGTSELAGNFPGKISSAELSIGYTFHCLGGNHKKEK